MRVLNIRVDDRLVHGVVATNWVPRLGVDRVIVIDAESANSQMLKSVLRMATPKNVKLSVINGEKALENFNDNRYADEKIMIVVKTLLPIIELLEGGYKFDKITIGNLGNQEKNASTVALTKYVSVNDETRMLIKKIADFDVKVKAQLIPEDYEADIVELLSKK
ncbi:MAG: PTS sugar transporter subunit IIB [Erysipelotrichaceae bacterium]|nr:PTS sugar transporter subunit IIB [Erysipelotrichaceae bacterium]MDD3924573.1 PTS sugar transporter subunit IIB [Erysipelotrichaceae bacterium]